MPSTWLWRRNCARTSGLATCGCSTEPDQLGVTWVHCIAAPGRKEARVETHGLEVLEWHTR